MKIYALYGLCLSCTDEIPELEPVRLPDPVQHDVLIEVRTTPLTDETTYPESLAHCTPDHAELHQPGLFHITIDGGAHIEVQLNPGTAFEQARPMLLGGAMALLLSQRGLIVLHGSATALRDVGMVLVANKGFGKSTFTAALTQHGAQLIADDVTALRTVPDGYFLERGGTQIRLWADAMHALGYNPADSLRVHPLINKHNWFAQAVSTAFTVPLKAVTILQPGDRFQVEKLSSYEAFFALLPHFYLSRWRHIPAISQQSFAAVTALVKQITVLRLTYIRDLDQLGDTVHAYLDACSTLGIFPP